MSEQIWITLDSRGPGGIETHVLVLAQGLVERGFDVTVMFLADHGPHPLKSALEENDFRFRHAGGINGLRRLLTRERPSLVHTHGYKAGISARLLCRMLGIPCVSTFHAGEPGNIKMRGYQWLDRVTAPLSQNIAVSEEIANELPAGTAQIDNFVPLPEGIGESGSRSVAFVGRLSEEKGADLFCALAGRLPAIQFDIYGDGPMRSELEATAPENVTFHGMQPGMDRVWPRIGLLCMPSRFEGLPMAALEAMSHNIPVACFGVGGLPGLVAETENGFVADPGDMDGLTNRITLWWCLGPAEQAAMGRAARRTIETRFSTAAVMPQVLRVYLLAMGHRRAADRLKAVLDNAA